MKHWPKLMMTLLALGLFSLLLSYPSTAQAEDSSEWDVLLKGEPELDKGPHHAPSSRSRARGDRSDRGSRRAVRDAVVDKKHPGPDADFAGKKARRASALDPGKGRGKGPHGRGHRWRRSAPPVDPDVLIEFLQANEPELAERLEKLRNEKPDEFRRRLPIVSRLYGPLIKDMKYDPTMTKLKVKGIRLRLRAKAAVDVLKSQDKDQHPKAQEQLRNSVADLFEVIVEQRELKYSRMQTKMTDRAAKMEEKADQKGKAQKKMARFQQRLEKHTETLDAWQRDKDSIIQERIDHLRHDKRPFPWGK